MITAKASKFFQPDLFCAREPVFVAARAAVQRKTLDRLKGSYGFSKKMIHRFEEPEEAPINSQIVIVYTKSEPMVLKSLELCKSEPLKAKQIEYCLRLVTQLREERHIPFPKVIPAVDGKFAASREGCLYYLMRFENGEAHYPHKDKRDIHAVAANIGKLYGVFRQLRDAFVLPQRRYFEPDEIQIVNRLQKAASNRKLNSKARCYWPAFQKQYEIAYKEFFKRGWSQKKSELCHIDLHPHNLLLRDFNVVGILDFESVLLGNRIACLGFSVFKLLRNYAALTKGSQSTMAQLRGIFLEELIQNKALDTEDVPLLSLGARLENIKRFLHGFRNQNEDNLCGGERMPIFGRALSGEIDYIFGEAASS